MARRWPIARSRRGGAGRGARRRRRRLASRRARDAARRQPAPRRPSSACVSSRMNSTSCAASAPISRRRMQQLQRSARSLADEVTNLEAQRATTARLVAGARPAAGHHHPRSHRRRATGLTQRGAGDRDASVARCSGAWCEIYKRGQLYDVEAMLSAQSFAALVARYKYLHDLALHDRALVQRVEALRNNIVSQARAARAPAGRRRAQPQREGAGGARGCAQLEGQRQRNLARRAAQRRPDARATHAARARRGAHRRASSPRRKPRGAAPRWPPTPAPPRPRPSRPPTSADSTGPSMATILYRFGRVVNPNNTTTRWNGARHRRRRSAPRCAASPPGEVVLAEQCRHVRPDGDHPARRRRLLGVRLARSRIDVRKGQEMQKGQVIGTVGAADPDLPPHLHFEIRPKGRAVDPLEWLRSAATISVLGTR